jgi:hypothetical protein
LVVVCSVVVVAGLDVNISAVVGSVVTIFVGGQQRTKRQPKRQQRNIQHKFLRQKRKQCKWLQLNELHKYR